MPVLLLELNEINFDQIRAYVELGKLPTLATIIQTHGVAETTSEESYHELEPWIQWVTAHTGKSLAEHRVFRLGDAGQVDLEQIWEVLERQGLTVGAISPMNALNRCRDAAFFIPDPWTSTEITGSRVMKALYRAVAQAVNDNAQSRITPSSALGLVAGLGVYARPVNYRRYLGLLQSAARGRPWAKAMMLDQLLADIFIRQVRTKRPDFASLFLNAGAHIQHHYMFNSGAYRGPLTNPDWYVPKGLDPVLQVYELYDRILAQIGNSFPAARLILATGLHQDPHPDVTFYWRLKDHSAFLRRAGVPFDRVEPRMSRDFMVFCANPQDAAEAKRRLESMTADGASLFEVDNRGSDLFVMFVWPREIPAEFVYHQGNQAVRGLREDVAFVAIKNGGHNGIGYLVDTGAGAGANLKSFPLREMPQRIADACGVSWVA